VYSTGGFGGGFYQKNGDGDCRTCNDCRNNNHSGLPSAGQIGKGQFYPKDKTAFFLKNYVMLLRN